MAAAYGRKIIPGAERHFTSRCPNGKATFDKMRRRFVARKVLGNARVLRISSSTLFQSARRHEMKTRLCIALVVTALGNLSVGWGATAAIPSPMPLQVAQGVWIIQGSMLLNREPDGNSVIFDVPDGLIVMDTGRHEWHRHAILTLAKTRRKPIVAIINSHWHLDHVSGNHALRAAYPDLHVYASSAIDRALAGFLASSAKQAAGYINDPQIAAEMRADIRGDLLTIQTGAQLKPDVVISASTTMKLGGHGFQINLAPNAATSGDVWLYDENSGVAALGDLVTLPAAFLDTACPEGWRAALAQVAATPFSLAIPGHGAPMTRAQFSLYRQAFESFIDCSKSTLPKEECGTSWASAVQPLLAEDPNELRRAKQLSEYYVELLRASAGRSKYCEAAKSVG
jgi:glyoxylase-like metal-dependent hydrolase (beta-lactamase superfamily II)